VDYLQNILGKTLATAYSARASAYAGVSTPLTWEEVARGFDPTDFTVRTTPARFKKVGDLWAALRTGKPVDLKRLLKSNGTRRPEADARGGEAAGAAPVRRLRRLARGVRGD
jgi:bifunctional non-homologous end joining protein LigD